MEPSHAQDFGVSLGGVSVGTSDGIGVSASVGGSDGVNADASIGGSGGLAMSMLRWEAQPESTPRRTSIPATVSMLA
jgi:hypothetical protein